MNIFWPMGCKKIDSISKFESLMRDDNYIGQEKLDGVRALMHVAPDGSLRFTTRGATLTDSETPIEITHRLPHLSKYKIKKLDSSVLDGELIDLGRTSAEVAGIVNFRSTVMVPSTIEFYIFDVLSIHNDLTHISLNHRLSMLSNLRNLGSVKGFHFVPYVYGQESKDNLLNRLFAMGKEGMVLKNLQSSYFQGKKKADTWYKVKKHDTLDVVIIGAKPPEQYYRDTTTGVYDFSRITKPWGEGWIGSIEFQFEEDGDTYAGYCSGITDELRSQLSDNSHCIKPEYIGRTMEVEYMERTKDGNLRHPRFIRLREEIEKNG
jgi:bifunctional non-homologous end joining protein LigD